VDLPFALPTSVAGLTLATVYGEEGILGRFLINMGVNVVYTRLGVAVAMIFVSFPFVVRTMQPVLQVREMVCRRGCRWELCMQLDTVCVIFRTQEEGADASSSSRGCLLLAGLSALRLCSLDHIHSFRPSGLSLAKFKLV
jgi:hypothetical protein